MCHPWRSGPTSCPEGYVRGLSGGPNHSACRARLAGKLPELSAPGARVEGPARDSRRAWGDTGASDGGRRVTGARRARRSTRRRAAPCFGATCYTPEITKVKFHWKMPVKVHWQFPATSTGQVTILWKMPRNIEMMLENATENPR